MAKRFIDTDLFRKPLMRGLQGPYKVLWIYLLCECDHAGVWDVELDVASMRLGVKLDPVKCASAIGDSIVQIDGGRKWWIPEFVAFQYGVLNPANRVHASVIGTLAKYGIDPLTLKKEAPSKDLESPLEGAKDKDMDKDKDQEKGVQGKTITVEPTTDQERANRAAAADHPFSSEAFRLAWYYFDQMRTKIRKPMTAAARQMIIDKLAKMGEAGAIDSLNKSTVSCWQDVFPPKPERLSPTEARRSTTSDRNQPITIGQRQAP